MKKRLFILGIALLSISASKSGEASVVVLGPSVTVTPQQPITAVFTDNYGNTYEQTVYYNPALGGIDVGNTTYASVYFPTFSTGYLWNNGFWVGENGYYWNNGGWAYVGPHWHDHWHNYWGPRGGYYGGWGRGDSVHVHNDVNVYNRGWHDGGWHDHGGGGWHDHGGGDWHGHGGGGGGHDHGGGGGHHR